MAHTKTTVIHLPSTRRPTARRSLAWLLILLSAAWSLLPVFCAHHAGVGVSAQSGMLVTLDGHDLHAKQAATSCEDAGNQATASPINLLLATALLWLAFTLTDLLRHFRRLGQQTRTIVSLSWLHQPPFTSPSVHF